MQGEADTHLRLPAVLDLAASETFLDTMRHACEAETVKVDASGVDVLTLPCIQIILAALRVNPGMTIENRSEAFVRAFADLALEWRQDGQEVAEQAAQPAVQQNPEQEAEAAFQAAAQQYNQLSDQPADMSEGEPVDQPSNEAESQIDAASAATEVSDGDASIIPDTQMDEACMTKRILTIDDSRTIRDMLNLTLSEAGFEVLQAVDGQDGIDVLEKQERVDLVITDINMPKMDGYGVIRHIRGQSRYNGMPVLVLTTESEKDKRNIAKEAGATGWMVKPFDPERLIATINKVAP
jgi:two-component system chemotaxis response regulator CheY